jgi:hypothetical protein
MSNTRGTLQSSQYRRQRIIWPIFTLVFGLMLDPSVGAAIRLGWQVPWATQGQLVMGLKHTNIASLLGLELTYVGFAYGAPLNQAALAGEVDVLLTADQPALLLLGKTDQFK